MTISSTIRKAGPFSGNNVTVAFPFTFKVFDETDIVVVATDASDVETTQTLTTHYTVSLNADQDASPGGTVTMLSAPASGTLLTITSDVPELQAVALTNVGGFYPRVINSALDRLTILVQQVAEETGRAVKIPISSSIDPDDLIASLEASEAAAAASAASAASSAAAAAAAIPVGSLGYTPVDEAGHTMTGELALPSIKLGTSASFTAFGDVVTKTVGAASGNVPLVGTKSATTTLAGLVEQSTSAENQAGTDDTVFPSVAGVAEMIAALSLIPGATQASTSGLSVDYTSIPSGTKHVRVGLAGSSTNGTAGMYLLLGDSGGLKVDGYVCGTSNGASTTTAFALNGGSGAAAGVYSGIVDLMLIDEVHFIWAIAGTIGRSDVGACFTVGGYVTLSSELTQLSITAGGDTLDLGASKVQYGK